MNTTHGTSAPPHGRGYISAPLWPYPLAFLALLVLGGIMGEVLDIEREIDPESLDHRVFTRVIHHRDDWPGLTRISHAFTQLGNPEVATTAVALIAVVMFVLWYYRVPTVRRGEPWFWIMVAGGGRLLSILLKLWFERARPPEVHRLVHETSYSFPSGHSVFSGVFFTLAAVLIARSRPAGPTSIKSILIGLCFVVALLVASSRIWLGAHYLTDVLAGFALGVAWASAACVIRFGWGWWADRKARAKQKGPVSDG